MKILFSIGLVLFACLYFVLAVVVISAAIDKQYKYLAIALIFQHIFLAGFVYAAQHLKAFIQ